MEKLDLSIVIKEFLYKAEFGDGKSLNTIRSMRADLKSFNEHIYECYDLKKLSDIDEFNLREFFIKLQQNKVGKRSINRKISTLKSFFRYLKEIEKISYNPAEVIVPPTYEKEIPDYLTLDEIRSLREVIEFKNYHSVRDRLIIELLYSSGMTSQELLGLGESVFDLEKREVVVTSFKKHRTIFFSERTREYFKRYIELKKEVLKERYREDILFINGSGTRLTDRSLRRLIDRYAEKAGIEREISPHTFRHTFAIHMLENGMTLFELKELLGHSNIETTKMYIEALDRKRKITAIKERV